MRNKTHKSTPPPLGGIIAPLITPLSADRLDTAGLERLVEHVLSGGVGGLFILGTSGEGPSLGHTLKRELIQRTAALVQRRVPVIVGISSTSLDDSVSIARFAADCGLAAVASTPPFYYPLGQAAVADWFEQLADRVPLPLLLYNYPAMTKIEIQPDTVRRLMDHPGIVGIKDSSGDLAYFRSLCELSGSRTDWSIFMGPEEKLLEAVRLGAGGGICAGANVFPRLFVELFDAAVERDDSRVAELQREVARVADELYTPERDCAGVIRGLKRALAKRGICAADVALPLGDLIP